MELRKRLDFRPIFTIAYILLAIVYVIMGLKPADAKSYEIAGELMIPVINLQTDVAKLELTNGVLETPDVLVGGFSRHESKTFLVGHSTTVFRDLSKIETGDEIIYNNESYFVSTKQVLPKAEINMNRLYAASAKKTVVIMTCAGQILDDGDATHRLILTAIKAE